MFIKHYIKNPKQTGAICSSSKKLASMMIKGIGINKANCIVEIGPGMGAFTKEILKNKQKESKFFAIEINKDMAQKLKNEIPNLEIITQNALNLENIIKAKKIDKIDNIISGIPWALLDTKEQIALLKVIHHNLSQNGYFTTFAYILPSPQAAVFKKLLGKFFKEVRKSKIVWQNVPPAFVYYCKK
ncbi:class I SAM-dependent methyltransferase [Campylobacter avium]|uniref:class I SAM-dependent methyltransferase n=1 Tax=Campylobacter avium TaxID=522485 RepID=UPI00255B7CEA|nr:rRNA adenine N-6-methyltransferase family protein [Campylobacter avium]